MRKSGTCEAFGHLSVKRKELCLFQPPMDPISPMSAVLMSLDRRRQELNRLEKRGVSIDSRNDMVSEGRVCGELHRISVARHIDINTPPDVARKTRSISSSKGSPEAAPRSVEFNSGNA